MKATHLVSFFSARIIDVFVVVLLGWLFMPTFLNDHAVLVYFSILGLSALLSLLVMPSFGVYASWRGNHLFALVVRVFASWTFVILLIIVALYLTKSAEETSRIWLISWWISSLFVMVSLRVLAYVLLGYLRRTGTNIRRVLLFGSADSINFVRTQLTQYPQSGYCIEEIIELSEQERLPEIASNYDELWLSLSFQDAQYIDQVLDALSQSTINIRWIPDNSKLLSVWQAPRQLIGLSALDLRVSPMAEQNNRLIKALEDRIIATIILIAISPLMFVLAIGVKLSSPGPIFYKQQRHGWNGLPFEMLKFRSMVVHQETEWITQATRGDHRITRFGAFLRRTSLDELPQFINVLRGDMSIVGPRPHAMVHNDYYSQQIDGYMMRHKMKPGITGWAQVNGWRGETETLDKMQKRVEFDMWYIEHWSLWLDIKIIFMTIFNGFVHKNAC
jgi:putative colanic acid biosynthesis UDP-glucose lipid carrier transferase